jgi:hypothetical protein
MVERRATLWHSCRLCANLVQNVAVRCNFGLLRLATQDIDCAIGEVVFCWFTGEKCAALCVGYDACCFVSATVTRSVPDNAATCIARFRLNRLTWQFHIPEPVEE